MRHHRNLSRKPLLAAVEGWALAGGFEFVLGCGLIVASPSARFGVPEVKRSLVAAAGGALLLPGRLPLALELLLTGDPIDAHRASQIGLANRLVAEGEAFDDGGRPGARISRNGPLAVAAFREIACGRGLDGRRGAAAVGVDHSAGLRFRRCARGCGPVCREAFERMLGRPKRALFGFKCR